MSAHLEHEAGIPIRDEAEAAHFRLLTPEALPARANGHTHAVARAKAPALALRNGAASITWTDAAARLSPREPAALPRHSLAAMMEALAARGSRTILVTSPERGAGTSSFVETAGRALAASGRASVVLVDADALYPTLHQRFGVPCERGLGEALDELYGFDLSSEDASQFGVGDWLEILRAQGRTGQLDVCGDGRRFAIAIVRGQASSISCEAAPPATRIGERLLQRGRITREQRDLALRVHEETARPLGEVLSSLAFVESHDLVEVLQQQCVRRLVELIGLRSPECRFQEVADSHVCAAGAGRMELPATRGLERILRGRVLEYLKQPFLRSQTPSFVRDTSLPNLRVLTAGARPCDPAAPSRQAPFGLLLDRLARAYDMVLVDAPATGPVVRSSPTLPLAARADGVLLVVRSGAADLTAARDAVDELRRAGACMLGIVLNRAPQSARAGRR